MSSKGNQLARIAVAVYQIEKRGLRAFACSAKHCKLNAPAGRVGLDSPGTLQVHPARFLPSSLPLPGASRRES
jgi:hypothetical protein